MPSKSNTGLAPTIAGALSIAQLDLLIANKAREQMEMAQNAAPLSSQLQVARELVALQSLRLVGEGGLMAVSDVTQSAQQAAATIGLLGQVMIDGLRDKVDDTVIDRITRIRDTGLEAIELTHAGVAQSLLDRTRDFKAGSSDIRKRDVAYAVAFDKMPGKPGSGRR